MQRNRPLPRLGRPAAAGSSSPGRPGRTTAATRRCGPTCAKDQREVAAARAGYSPATLRSVVRDFRAGKTGFFLNPRPGPTRAPAKNAARETIIELRRAGHSATEISEALAATPTPLNRTGVAEVINEAGFGRLPVRPPAERGAPYRDHPRRAELARLHHARAQGRDQGGRTAAGHARTGRPRPARPDRRRRLPRHRSSPR